MVVVVVGSAVVELVAGTVVDVVAVVVGVVGSLVGAVEVVVDDVGSMVPSVELADSVGSWLTVVVVCASDVGGTPEATAEVIGSVVSPPLDTVVVPSLDAITSFPVGEIGEGPVSSGDPELNGANAVSGAAMAVPPRESAPGPLRAQ